MRLAMYEPEIAQNVGTMLRTCGCFGIGVDIIEPCGFPFSSAKLKRAGMDYLDQVSITRHNSWEDFLDQASSRVILLTPHTDKVYTDIHYQPDDILLVGQESCGVPEHVFQKVGLHVKIPMSSACRSLNVAISAGIVLSEALRQKGFITI